MPEATTLFLSQSPTKKDISFDSRSRLLAGRVHAAYARHTLNICERYLPPELRLAHDVQRNQLSRGLAPEESRLSGEELRTRVDSMDVDLIMELICK